MNDWEDSEDIVEELAGSAYMKVLARKSAVMIALLVVITVIVACDWAAAIAALLVTPWWARAVIAAVMVAEVARAVRMTVKMREEKAKDPKPVKGDGMLSGIDAMHRIRKNPIKAPWRRGLRDRTLWLWLGSRAFYGACVLAVVSKAAGIPAGTLVALLYLAGCVVLPDQARRSMEGIAKAVTFIDPREERNSPEIG